MAGTTISTYVFHSVTLDKGGYNGPLSITSKAGIYDTVTGQTALYVPSGAANATVTNAGFIGAAKYKGAAGNGGIGINVAATGAVINLESGGVVEGGFGLDTGVGGVGISISASRVLLTNNGTVKGGVTDYARGGDALDVSAAATVTNTGVFYGGFVYNNEYNHRYGGTGGNGVSLSNEATLSNSGKIYGGEGSQAYGHSETGGTGGVGIYLDNASLTNSGFIRGGNAGPGLYYSSDRYDYSYGGNGGTGAIVYLQSPFLNSGTVEGGAGGVSGTIAGSGGTGVQVAGNDGFAATNEGTILGGVGGGIHGTYFAHSGNGGLGIDVFEGTFNNEGKIFGGNGGYADNFDAYRAGAGGMGALVEFDGTLTNSGTIAAGSVSVYHNKNDANGATGAYVNWGTLFDSGHIVGGNATAGYMGGSGGIGLSLYGLGPSYSSLATVTSTGTIIGGGGGYSYGAYFGGLGGTGVSLGTNATLTNHGHITGGLGGIGNYRGGQGGVGAEVNGGKLVNSAHISGGTGGYGSNYGGFGGVGVYINGGGLLANAGTIGYGLNGKDRPGIRIGDDSAVVFHGAGTLEVEKGAVFHGFVVADSAAADLLEFSGKSSTAFAGIGTQILDFHSIKFLSGAAWTISGDIAGLAAGQTITGFGSTDAITVTNAAASSGSVAVGTAGVVTITAGSGVIKLDIAGAKVGATNYTFSNYTLKETAPNTPGMAFIAPASPVNWFHGGMPELSAVVAAPDGKTGFFTNNENQAAAQTTFTTPHTAPAASIFEPTHGAVPVLFTL